MIPALIASFLVVLVAMWGLVAVFVRRMVTWSPRKRSVSVTHADAKTVTLEHGRFALEPGEFTLVFGDGGARLGLPTDAGATVTRDVLSLTGTIPLGSVRLSPDPGSIPAIAGAFTDAQIPSPGGDMPAWVFGPESTSWAIHVHGVRSSRLNALWGVPGATEAGYRSLVIAYRGSPDGRRTHRNAGLGYLEAGDVAAAVDYAVKNGAERIVLFGWSMGASAALLTAETAQFRDRITGLVLIAPTLSWRHVMRAGASRMRMPKWVSALVEFAITTPMLARLVGMPDRVDLDALDWVSSARRLKMPALVFGSRGDTNVPFELITMFDEANPGTVHVHEVAECTHGWEPNVDPERFTHVIRTWLESLS